MDVLQLAVLLAACMLATTASSPTAAKKAATEVCVILTHVFRIVSWLDFASIFACVCHNGLLPFFSRDEHADKSGFWLGRC